MKRGDPWGNADQENQAVAHKRKSKGKKAKKANTALSPLLHEACKRSDVEEVRRLLAEGADPNALDAEGRPPLDRCVHWASVGFALGQPEARCIGLLLEAGADPLQGGVGPEMVAYAKKAVCSALEYGDAKYLAKLLGLPF